MYQPIFQGYQELDKQLEDQSIDADAYADNEAQALRAGNLSFRESYELLAKVVAGYKKFMKTGDSNVTDAEILASFGEVDRLLGRIGGMAGAEKLLKQGRVKKVMDILKANLAYQSTEEQKVGYKTKEIDTLDYDGRRALAEAFVGTVGHVLGAEDPVMVMRDPGTFMDKNLEALLN